MIVLSFVWSEWLVKLSGVGGRVSFLVGELVCESLRDIVACEAKWRVVM